LEASIPSAVSAADAPRPPDLTFSLESAAAVEYAVVPTLGFKLLIERVGGGPVRSIAFNAQIRIAATRRSHDEATQVRLMELFGPAKQWSRSLTSLLWTNASMNVPPFTDSTLVDLPVTCTYDFEVTATKYLQALEDGEVPIEMLFSGTIFYAAPDGRLQIAHVPWDKEATFRLPIQVWKDMMDHYFPNSSWLRLRRDTFERLYAYKARNMLMSWEDTLDSLLPAEVAVPAEVAAPEGTADQGTNGSGHS
jgi:hypothetical protein